MSGPLEFAVTGLGAVTPVGLGAASTCAALSAGITRMKELETHLVEGEFFDLAPVVGGRVPTEWFDGGPRPAEWPAHERFGLPLPAPPDRLVAADDTRLVDLALPALEEAWHQSGLHLGAPDRLGLYLGLDSEEPGERVVESLRSSLRKPIRSLVVAREGRAAGLVALHRAARDLLRGEVTTAIVGGVDSLIRTPALERLDRDGILRSAGRPQGVIPGEAAAFVIVETPKAAQARQSPTLAVLMATATGEEPTAGGEEPNQAVGLTGVLRDVCESAGGLERPPLVLCDLNGDRYRATEWGLAAVRTLGRLHGDAFLDHPADRIGDPGAASGVLNLAWAAIALREGHAGRDRAVVWGASDGKARAAAVLGRAGPA